MDIDLINKEASEVSYTKEMAHLARACAGVIHVRADEIWRAVMATRHSIVMSMKHECCEWDISTGLFSVEDINIVDLAEAKGEPQSFGDFLDTVGEFANNIEEQKTIRYYVAINAHNFWGSPHSVSMLQQLSILLPTTNVRLVLITPDIPPPDELDGWQCIHFGAPSFTELEDYATSLIKSINSPVTKDLNADAIKNICYAGMGMSRDAFEMHLSVGLTDSDNEENGGVTAESLAESVNVGKTDILNSSDLLELYKKEDMAHVGGMENLKEWVSKRSNCYSEEAKAHGIESPKGCVLLGPPGTGKSLAAKAIASEMKVSLIRLDFGKVFNSLVGSSEQRIRKALKDVESMAPCVVLADEIDKGLGGIGGGGDSGTSSRVLGTFLTWLNDNESPVFTVASANSIENLPPELLRKGRFDQIFATGLPSERERKDILRIHLDKRGWSDDFEDSQLATIANHMKGFVGAEIESVVKDALIDSFNDNKDLTTKHLIRASKSIIPLSVAYAEQIQKMTLWAKTHAVSASRREDDKVAPITKNRRTRRPQLRAKNEDIH